MRGFRSAIVGEANLILTSELVISRVTTDDCDWIHADQQQKRLLQLRRRTRSGAGPGCAGAQ